MPPLNRNSMYRNSLDLNSDLLSARSKESSKASEAPKRGQKLKFLAQRLFGKFKVTFLRSNRRMRLSHVQQKRIDHLKARGHRPLKIADCLSQDATPTRTNVAALLKRQGTYTAYGQAVMNHARKMGQSNQV